jgi:hypothetical protein
MVNPHPELAMKAEGTVGAPTRSTKRTPLRAHTFLHADVLENIHQCDLDDRRRRPTNHLFLGRRRKNHFISYLENLGHDGDALRYFYVDKTAIF